MVQFWLTSFLKCRKHKVAQKPIFLLIIMDKHTEDALWTNTDTDTDRRCITDGHRHKNKNKKYKKTKA